MARTPNYNHERRERDRLKAAKKAEKLAAKAARKKSDGEADPESGVEPEQGDSPSGQ